MISMAFKSSRKGTTRVSGRLVLVFEAAFGEFQLELDKIEKDLILETAWDLIDTKEQQRN